VRRPSDHAGAAKDDERVGLDAEGASGPGYSRSACKLDSVGLVFA
jgi:hypothetical protein